MTPFRVSLVFLVLTVVGVATSLFLEINFTPSNESSSFIVSFSSGRNEPPLVTEEKVTSIVEGALSTLTGLKEIKSVSRYGGGYVTVRFDEVANLQSKRLEVLTALRQVRPQLPATVPFPSIDLGNHEDKEEPLLIYSLTSSLPTSEIVELANAQVVPAMGLNLGIKRVELSSDSRPSVIITFDSHRLRDHELAMADLQRALFSTVRNEQIGTITSRGCTKSVSLNTLPQDITDLLELPLTSELRLGDLAEVKIAERRPGYISRLNGKNAVLVKIFAHESENKPKLAAAVQSEVDDLDKVLPENLQLSLSYDDTEFITKELAKISKRAMLSIVILSVLILLVYRRWKQLVVLMGSVLVTIGISALVMYFFRVPVHLYTIAGLTISFGLVIDNSIMVIDHIRRKQNLKVIIALLAATLTTIAALLVIFVLPSEERVGLGDFAIAITIALCASLVVSLFFTPSLSSVVGVKRSDKPTSVRIRRRLAKTQNSYFCFLVFLSRYRKLLLALLILCFGLPVYMVPKTIEGVDVYNRTIGSEIYQQRIRPVTDKVLGGMLRSFYLNVFESGGYRTPEKTKLYVSASLDEGHTIEQMDAIVRNVETYLDNVEGLDSYRTSIYSGKYAQVVIEFTEETGQSSLPYILKNRLIQRSLDWGGVDWSVYGVGRGFSNAAGESLPSFRLKLKGYNYQELEGVAEDLASRLLTHPRIKEVNINDRISWRDTNTEQFVLKPTDHVVLESYLASLGYVSDISPAMSPVNYITVGNVQFPMNFEAEDAKCFSIFRLQNESPNMPLVANSVFDRKLKSGALYREDRSYVRVLSFEYYGSYRFGDEYLKKVLNSYMFPPGYTHERVEYEWYVGKAKRQYAIILLVLVVVFVICAATFESLRLPVLIILMIPLSFIGIFITFSWGGFYFDQGGYAAFILLAGIVVNATIFILSEARSLPPQNWNANVIKACNRKFIPILLTVLSTCLGLVPFLIDGQQEVFWFSFAVGVIGGLLFSMLLVSVAFPIFLMKK